MGLKLMLVERVLTRDSLDVGATTAAPSATTTTAETAAAPSLGGISLAKGTGMPFKPEGKAVLDLPVPPEILQIVEELKYARRILPL